MNNNNHDSQMSLYVNWLYRNRIFVLVTTIILVTLLGTGISKLGFNNNYKIYFSDDNPELKAQNNIVNEFGDSRNIFIGVLSTKGSFFSEQKLKALRELELEAWKTPYSKRVDAITNYQHTYSDNDELIIGNLVPIDTFLNNDIQRIKNVALNEQNLLGRLIDLDGNMAGINITVTTNPDSTDQNLEAVNYVRLICNSFENRHPELKTFITGQAALSVAFSESSKQDGKTLLPLMLLIILIFAVLTTRSIWSSFTVLIITALSIIIALGITGMLGIKLNALSFASPTIIMTLGITNSIHFLLTFLENFREGRSKIDSLKASMELNFKPIFFTSLTTVIGFLVLNFNDAPPFHDLGNISALGVIGAFLLTVYTLPSFISILPIKNSALFQSNQIEVKKLRISITQLISNNRRKLIFGFFTLSFFIGSFTVKNEFNDNFTEYFSNDIEFRNSTDKISDFLAGIYVIEFALPSGESGTVTDPEYQQVLENFSSWLIKQENVTHVLGMNDIIKRVNRSLHYENPKFFSIPDTQEKISQYLLLYEMSVPYGLDLTNQINMDKSSSKLTVIVDNISSRELLELTTKAESWLSENAPKFMQTKAASTPIMFAHLGQRQINGMIEGGITAIVLISFLMILLLKDLKLGLLSLIPNLIPILLAFGFWGIFNGEINSAAAMVFGMTLGIIVDDTVHILYKFNYAMRKLGMNQFQALEFVFEHAGNAIITTSLILMAGFSVLGFSSFEMNSAMGIMSVVVIGFALILDLFLVPAILLSVIKKNNQP